MASYKILVHRDFEKEIKKITKKDVIRILEAIGSLATNPYQTGSQKISGSDAYRIRIGLYRVVYRISDGLLIVFILKVAHRKDVYK
ncbi:MAG: type II toxin-antitoxin system RelE family toxin [Pseudobdellovibrionaceae bacterium]